MILFLQIAVLTNCCCVTVPGRPSARQTSMSVLNMSTFSCSGCQLDGSMDPGGVAVMVPANDAEHIWGYAEWCVNT